MNDWIKDNFCELKHSEKFKERPDTVFTSKDGENVREQFCKLSDDGKKIWSEYTQKKSNAVNKASKLIGEMFEHEYGFNALHIGNFPNDWVKPGGLPKDNYRQTCDEIQSSKNVVEKKELKKPKYHQENKLFERSVNIDNHARTHKCSGYCLKSKTFRQKFDPNKHLDIKKEDKYTNKNGDEMVKTVIQECRMRFGQALKYDPSGEKNITRGIPKQMNPAIVFDNNGQPRYLAHRNHPRILQQPYSFP